MTELINNRSDLTEWLTLECNRLEVPNNVDTALLEAFLALRNDCLDLLRAAVAGEALPTGAVMRINAIVASAPLPRMLGEHAGRAFTAPACSGDPRQDLLATLAGEVVDLLGDQNLYQLAFCDAPSCGQFFHRQRPNQRWCCPACGDRIRAARHYKRADGQHEY